MKNVIAFSLWGDKPIYWKGAVSNIKLAKEYFPEFICRFYVDENCESKLIESLKDDNVEIIIVGKEKEFQGMFWRFDASQENDVDIFLSRDCDSRLSYRERVAIDEWIRSEKDFHIIRDHPYHTVPILGGTWASRNGLMKKINLNSLIENWRISRTIDIVRIQGHREHSINAFGDDQDFLAKVVYPLVRNFSFEHSDFGISFGNSINQISEKRKEYEFIGDVFDENENRHPEYWKILKNSMIK